MDETGRAQAGTDGYSSGTHGYSSGTHGGHPEAGNPDAGNPEADGQPFWKRLGHESEEAFWVSVGDKPSKPTPELPAADLPQRGRRTSPHVRQVNIKVTPEVFDGLKRLAVDYGVAPSTMARMLVSRGVRLAEKDRSS
jgi:hypothetical protein